MGGGGDPVVAAAASRVRGRRVGAEGPLCDRRASARSPRRELDAVRGRRRPERSGDADADAVRAVRGPRRRVLALDQTRERVRRVVLQGRRIWASGDRPLRLFAHHDP